MDPSRFTEFKTGQLSPITIDERLSDFVFEPDLLPPKNWEPSLRLWPLVTLARDRISTLNGIGSVLPNPFLLLRPLQRREAIRSNSIEGTFVTPRQLLLFEAEHLQKDHEVGQVDRSDWRDVYLYDHAITEGCKRVVEGSAIDTSLICDLHRLLLSGARGSNKSPGVLRNVQVYVDASRRYNPPPSGRIEEYMKNLVEYMAGHSQDPLVRAFIAHYQFEAIHPFKDGNGRIGRLLLSLSVFKWLAHSHAWLYLSEFFDDHRSEYIQKLFAVSTSGDWEEWVEFCLHGTVSQSNNAIDRCKRLNAVKADYEERIGHESPRMGRIIRGLFSTPFVNIGQVCADCEVTYNTARKDIERLCEVGILTELPDHRPRTFCANEIYHIAYD